MNLSLYVYSTIAATPQLFCILLGIKAYSNWPTIPQVFIGGEFIGGCDIMLQMHQNGDLIEELRKAGIRSALLDKKAEDTK
jgi:monothiol glutaredoxin